MSDSCREQRPLLYEDNSEEEHSDTRYQRRFQPMVFRGRAKINAKGAAAIFKVWPEHLSSFVTYWWIGLGMIAIITFIIYNSIGTLTALPRDHLKYSKFSFSKDINENYIADSGTRNVYMHLFIEYNEKVDFNVYIPYIDEIAAKYPDFKYHLIVVTNDTYKEVNALSEKKNNENALHLLWEKQSLQRNKNIDVAHVTLSKYMENTPLSHHWQSVPKPFIEFLTRAVSVWDKGGIALNPMILTPSSAHSVYSKKIHSIFEYYPGNMKINNTQVPINKMNKPVKDRVNNIRDIINVLENTNIEVSNVSQNLTEAESSNLLYVTSSNKTPSKPKEIVYHPDNVANIIPTKSWINRLEYNETNTEGIIPKFLNFLFNKTSFMRLDHKEKRNLLTRKRKHVVRTNDESKNKFKNRISNKLDMNPNENLLPIIIAPTKNYNVSQDSIISGKMEFIGNKEFTIDIKGNIIASAIPCHAFLGSIFNHSFDHRQESVTDFIISELSIFCKGVLSSCNGIEIILL